jgi:signal transduction histidine kinase
VLVTILVVAFCWLMSLWTLVAAGTVAGDPEAFGGSWRVIIGFLLSLGAGVLLIWRRRRPFAVAVAAAIPPLCFVADSTAALIALGWLAAAGVARRWLVVAAAIGYAATVLALWYDSRRVADYAIMQWLFGATQSPDHADVPFAAVLVIALVLTAIPIGVGLLVAARSAVNRGEVREHELQTEVARREERGRIAREMHDVLGHRLSLLNLQVGALEVNADPGQTPALAKTIRGTTADALSDLRQVIGVLADGGPAGAPGGQSRHQPGLNDLPDLIDQARQSGAVINVTVLLDQFSSAPADLGVVVYRLVQESITNALRHAPGQPIDVTVRGGPGVGITVEAANNIEPGMSDPEPVAGSGHGLLGMAARVEELGGRISDGPTDQGRFVVAAWLPWADQTAGSDPRGR